MNFLHEVLSDTPTKDKNILELRDYLANNKVKFSDTPRMENSAGKYYYNALPNIPVERDIYKKLFNIGTIKVNWSKSTEPIETLYAKLPQQYFVSVQVCDKDYTKVKFVNQEVMIIVYDNEEKLKKDISFYNRCFKTIEEQNKEKDDLRTLKMHQLKKLTTARKYKK